MDSFQSRQQEYAHRQATTAAWSSVVINIILMVGKGVVGQVTGSRALFADAVHSAADVAGSFAVMVGLQVARKPPDHDHPYGHGKAELISSALVACLLVVASVDVGYRSIRALFEPPTHPEWTSAYTALAAIVVKEVLYRYIYRLGKRLNSKSLLASAVDHRSDVYSSLAALVGILLSLGGQRFGVHWLLYMDAVAGAFVAVLVVKMGYEIAVDSTQMLMDKAVSDEDLQPYSALIEQVPGVEHIDEMRARDHGTYVIIDVKISVDADMTVAQGHSVAAEVKQQLREAFPRIQDALVHVNPFFKAQEDHPDD